MQSCGSHITQSCYRYMQPQFVFITVPCSAMWIMVSFSFTCSFPFSPCLNSSVITNKNGTSCSSPLCPLPTPDLLAHTLLQTPTYLYTHPLWWFQCSVMLFCMYICMYVTWPLPFHAIVQQTDAVPPSTLIIPVIPISTVPAEPAVISSSTSQVFFFLSLFSLYTPSLPYFFALFLLVIFSWSLPFHCSLMGLKDYQPQSRVKYHGSPWLIASACQPAGGSGKPHKKTDREIEQASDREWI